MPTADASLDGADAEPVVTRPRALVARENATKSTGPRTLAGNQGGKMAVAGDGTLFLTLAERFQRIHTA